MKDATVEEAKAFARTLMQKTYSEAIIGQLMLTFEGMNLISAKALMMLVNLEKDSK